MELESPSTDVPPARSKILVVDGRSGSANATKSSSLDQSSGSFVKTSVSRITRGSDNVMVSKTWSCRKPRASLVHHERCRAAGLTSGRPIPPRTAAGTLSSSGRITVPTTSLKSQANRTGDDWLVCACVWMNAETAVSTAGSGVGAICRQAKKWRAEGVPVPVVAANVWSETLRRPDALRLIDALAETGVDPKGIEIECPRGSTGDPDLIRALVKIQSLGVRLASEEHATGGRPRAQLTFDTLKIPFPISREYVAKAKEIAAVVAEARTLDARVVADSVESTEQENALASLGVEIVQGYLYGPEVTPAELPTLITRPGA